MSASDDVAARLTEAQKVWLRDAVCRSGLGSGSVTNRTANALERLGFARRRYDGFGLGAWLITDLGRTHLASASHSEQPRG